MTESERILRDIRQTMERECISVHELSTRMNIPPSTLASRLNQKNISLNMLSDICKALNFSLQIIILPR